MTVAQPKHRGSIESVIANIPASMASDPLLERYGIVAVTVLTHGASTGDDGNYQHRRRLRLDEEVLGVNVMTGWGNDNPASVSFALGHMGTLRTVRAVAVPLGEHALDQASMSVGFADTKELAKDSMPATLRNFHAWTPTHQNLLGNIVELEMFIEAAGVAAT